MAETRGLSEQSQREHAPGSRSRPTSAPAPQRSVAEGDGMREALQKQAPGAWQGRSDLAGAREEVVRRARNVARLQAQYDSTVRRFCAAHRQHGGQWCTRHDLEEGDEAVIGHGGEEEGVGRRRDKEGGQQKTRGGDRMRESEGQGGGLQCGKAEQATVEPAKARPWPGQQQGGQAPAGPLEAWDEMQSVLAVVDLDSLIRCAAVWASGQKGQPVCLAMHLSHCCLDQGLRQGNRRQGFRSVNGSLQHGLDMTGDSYCLRFHTSNKELWTVFCLITLYIFVIRKKG
ncbi:hypothetical protein HaLaN_24249 [Haematococcus lacustris]|uniref:Uncharacterized protein n=1 Tax=Haematococcus lacustris TaxID=44745 RepID=A0A6A0A350_HAELA|nr:hypothetical protein HaLaN_24249 [Haematococcus lacustris]